MHGVDNSYFFKYETLFFSLKKQKIKNKVNRIKLHTISQIPLFVSVHYPTYYKKRTQ